jgi:dimethylhistidine N-methyltransferase
MQAHREAIAASVGTQALVVELGSGSGLKTERLLRSLERPTGLILVDISRDALVASARSLGSTFPDLDVLAVCADYTQSFTLPAPRQEARRVVAYFPGSTIGNFSRAEAEGFLAQVAHLVGPGGGLLLGVDRVKDPAIIEAAYNDARGITAEFNLNLLDRLTSAGASVDRTRFQHRAIYNREAGRVEMHLVSTADQLVRIANRTIPVAEGEVICTEHSHKYDLDSLVALAHGAGFALQEHWSDPHDWFTVCHLVAA